MSGHFGSLEVMGFGGGGVGGGVGREVQSIAAGEVGQGEDPGSVEAGEGWGRAEGLGGSLCESLQNICLFGIWSYRASRAYMYVVGAMQ